MRCTARTKLDRIANLATLRFIAKYHDTTPRFTRIRTRERNGETSYEDGARCKTERRVQNKIFVHNYIERRISKRARTTVLSFVDGRRKFLENSCSPNFQNSSWRRVVVVFGILEVGEFLLAFTLLTFRCAMNLFAFICENIKYLYRT